MHPPIALTSALLLCGAALTSPGASCLAADTPPAENRPGVAGKEAPAMKILVRKPEPGELEKLGVKEWPIWRHNAGDLPWTYEEAETCYILEGDVTVEAEGQKVSFGAGDWVVFPQGLKCVWKIHKAVKKHYHFGDLPPGAQNEAPQNWRDRNPPGWDTWTAAQREEWKKAVEWGKHVVSIRSDEAGIEVGLIGRNIELMEKASRLGVDPKIVLEAILQTLETHKTLQATLRERGFNIVLDK